MSRSAPRSEQQTLDDLRERATIAPSEAHPQLGDAIENLLLTYGADPKRHRG